jgi:hypothetical protein
VNLPDDRSGEPFPVRDTGVTNVEPRGFVWPDPADVGQGDVPWTVLADPEGNVFCVLGRG